MVKLLNLSMRNMIFELERELNPKIVEGIIREHLASFSEFKFPGTDKLHLRLLRECADVVIELILINFEKLWQNERYKEADTHCSNF